MTEPLAGKRALVTGASSGIGAATARALVAAGAQVLATGRNAAGLAGFDAMAGDLTDAGFRDRLAARADSPDIVVANAGRLKHAPFLDGDPDDWRAVFELNVLATLALLQPLAKGMVRRGSGHIVLVSSMLARRVTRNTMVYAASKHAIAAVAGGLRLELEPFGVRVTEVAPGLVGTNVFRDIDDARVTAAYAAMDFAFLRPGDVAHAILAALTAPPGSSADLIELRPLMQP